MIDGIVENSSRIRSPWSYVLISQLGGAIADRDEDATAYSDRTAAHNININGVWLPYDEMGEKRSSGPESSSPTWNIMARVRTSTSSTVTTSTAYAGPMERTHTIGWREQKPCTIPITSSASTTT